MPAYDTTFKELAKTGLAELVRFLLPEMTFADLVELPPEFPSTLRATDLLLKTIGHRHGPRLCLFESQVQREVALPRLLLLRAALAHFHYDLPVTAVLLALTREAVVPGAHRYGFIGERALHHEITVRKLYEEPVEPILERAAAAVLPLCAVMAPRDGDRAALLERILLRIGGLDLSEERRTRLLQWATTFATLHLPAGQVTLLSEDLYRRHPSMLQPLRDFPLLRDSFNEGKKEGQKEGKREGIKEGKREGIKEGKKEGRTEGKREGRTEGKAEDLLELLEARGLELPESVRATVSTCNDLERLSTWWKRALKPTASLDDIFA